MTWSTDLKPQHKQLLAGREEIHKAHAFAEIMSTSALAQEWWYWHAIRMAVRGNPRYEHLESEIVSICDERLADVMRVWMR